jgi:predicted nucleic acid-binding protein
MNTRPDLFDTNVLVAATIPGHVHYESAHARLVKLANGRGACAAHTLAEAYTTFTRVNGYRITPSDAARIIEVISTRFEIISLTPAEYVETIKDTALLGLAGPIVYDALLIACARKINARTIYTHNLKHFRQLAPDLVSRIREP